ncbi:MAG: kelch repeat-containing protein [bacterium]|nr:kelch repeat-containing protein [bacterium]
MNRPTPYLCFPLMVAGLASPRAVTAQTPLPPTWQLESPATSPPARQDHCLEFDSTRGVAVMFGGYDWTPNQYYRDLWEYDGSNWTQRSLGSGPAARREAGMCFDSNRGVMVLFGGLRGGTFTPVTYFGDTWEYDGTSWRQVAVSAATPAARFATLTFDSVRDVAVLFAGGSATGFLTDTWEYDGSGWVQRITLNSPPRRPDYAAAFDSRRGRLVAHPGYVWGQTGPFETFEYDGNDWKRAVYSASPGAYPKPRMTYDSNRGVVVLQASSYISGPDTWEYDGSDWRQRQLVHPVAGLAANGLTFDSRRGAVLAFGGERVSGSWIVGTDQTSTLAIAAQFEALGSPCAVTGPAPQLAAQSGGLPHAGSTFVAEVSPVASTGLTALVVGFAAANGLLDWIGLPGCQQTVRPDAALLLPMQGNRALWMLALPAQPALHGVELFAQALVLDSNGLPTATTNGVRLVVGL